MCDNLIRLVSNLSAGEHVSLEQLVVLMVSNSTIPPGVVTLLWDMFARKVHTAHVNTLTTYSPMPHTCLYRKLVLYTTVVLYVLYMYVCVCSVCMLCNTIPLTQFGWSLFWLSSSAVTDAAVLSMYLQRVVLCAAALTLVSDGNLALVLCNIEF